MAGTEEILKPGEAVPIPEVSAAGLAGIIGECVDFAIASREFERAGNEARVRTFEKGQNYDESHRFSKKFKRITKVLDKVIPLPEEVSWKDEIQRLADVHLGIVPSQEEEEQARERSSRVLPGL